MNDRPYSLYMYAQGMMRIVAEKTLGDNAAQAIEEVNVMIQSEPPPPPPKGFSIVENIDLNITNWQAFDTIPFSCYNNERILVCSRIENPALMKPWALKTHWLWLHLLCIGAIESNRLANACYTKRIQPCIVGMKPQLQECFPLAYETIRGIHKFIADYENLPF